MILPLVWGRRGRVRFGVTPSSAQGSVQAWEKVATAVVGDAFDGHAVVSEAGDRHLQDADGGARLLVVEDPGIGQAGVVVDHGVTECLTDDRVPQRGAGDVVRPTRRRRTVTKALTADPVPLPLNDSVVRCWSSMGQTTGR